MLSTTPRSTSAARTCWGAVGAALLFTGALYGDTFTVQRPGGARETVEARLLASRRGAHLLEMPDGQLQIVPDAAVLDRKPGEDPPPLTPEQVRTRLEEKYGADRFRSAVDAPFVVGLVLGSELPKTSETRVKALLDKIARFMKNVEQSFGLFLREIRAAPQPPRYPLVVLVFELDSDFEAYSREITGAGAGGSALSANVVAGFYYGMTNCLAFRLSECHSFDVPLHEAIHQQVYNRGFMQRLAPIPHWFDEGIATGFESTNGRVGLSPIKVAPRYARQAFASNRFDWQTMVVEDRVFMGDVLAGEAYGQAWGLHWLTVTKYRDDYRKYVALLAQKEPLQDDSPEIRLKEFQDCFQKTLAELEQEFPKTLQLQAQRQKIALQEQRPVGYSQTISNLGFVELTGIMDRNTGQLRVEGTLHNINPLRTLAYHVTVETDGGTYAEWHVAEVGLRRSVPLAAKFADKKMANVRMARPPNTFRVRIRSTVPDSPTAAQWSRGELPVPSAPE